MAAIKFHTDPHYFTVYSSGRAEIFEIDVDNRKVLPRTPQFVKDEAGPIAPLLSTFSVGSDGVDAFFYVTPQRPREVTVVTEAGRETLGVESDVLNVLCNRRYLVIEADDSVCVYGAENVTGSTPKLYEIPHKGKGKTAKSFLTAGTKCLKSPKHDEPVVVMPDGSMANPSYFAALDSRTGFVNVFDLDRLARSSVKRSSFTFKANNSPIRRVCISEDCKMFASISKKGREVQVFHLSLSTPARSFKLRRGKTRAKVVSLMFSWPMNYLVSVTSQDKETNHNFDFVDRKTPQDLVKRIGTDNELAASVIISNTLVNITKKRGGKRTAEFDSIVQKPSALSFAGETVSVVF